MNADCGSAESAIAAVFPLNQSGEVVALRASIDASRMNSGVLAVAGVSFGYDRAVKAQAKWERLMDGRTFHMTDLNARQNDFHGICDDEVHRIMLGIVEIINAYAAHTVAVSWDVSAISEQFPNPANDGAGKGSFLDHAFRVPYGPLLHHCMFAMGRFANAQSEGRQISYVLEAGDEGQPGFIRYIDGLLADPQYGYLLDRYSLSRLTTTPKDEMEGIFHSADFVAWEWARHVDRQSRKQPMRKSLSAVTGNRPSDPDYFGMTLSDQEKNFFRHFDGRHANRFVRFIRETTLAKSPEEIADAVSRWEASR